ncbi:S-adenosyl-L-methionine-dependent methyltransferase [Helicostylum pulchrum]|nr:S-adenosyl-L-methionine-dependent methyltransferase [Helicostylum pulchrum]
MKTNQALRTFTSEEEEATFQDDFISEEGPTHSGRTYHNVDSSAYWMPRDEEEQLRLTGSHFAAKEVFKGNFLPQVEDYISFEKGVDCLDIGCGPGTFLMDMAQDYPKSNFVGIDIAAMVNINFKLPNVSFALGNVLEGLHFPDNSFEYIQLRVFVNALRKDEWPVALKEIHRLLKPGGCVGFFEYEPRETGSEDCKKVFRAVVKLMEYHHQEPLAGHKLKEWVVEAGMEHVVTVENAIDCGPDTGSAKRWRWIWSQSCTSMGPYLSPLLDVKFEDWPQFLNNHMNDMVRSHGHITIVRSVARKPLN